MMAKPQSRGRGRPPADPDNPRIRRITILISDADMELVTADQRDGEGLGAVIYRWLQPRLQQQPHGRRKKKTR